MTDDADMTDMVIGPQKFRLQSRVDACLERAGGDHQKAAESSGIGISYGLHAILSARLNMPSASCLGFDKLLKEAHGRIMPESAPRQKWTPRPPHQHDR